MLGGCSHFTVKTADSLWQNRIRFDTILYVSFSLAYHAAYIHIPVPTSMYLLSRKWITSLSITRSRPKRSELEQTFYLHSTIPLTKCSNSLLRLYDASLINYHHEKSFPQTENIFTHRSGYNTAFDLA
jgi:hypothetical protein